MRGFGGFVVWTVALVGCKPKLADLPGSLTVSPEVLDFGSVGIDAEATEEVTLTNEGGGPVSLLSLTLTEGDPDVWYADKNGVSTIEGGESATILVVFSPENAGQVYSGAVQVRTDNVDPASFYVTLAGRGGLSDADADGDGWSIADGDCDDYNGDVNPDEDEVCDGRDTDCNGSTPGDERDDDGDGSLVCAGDCDDGNGAVYPGAAEVCDGADNDCDNSTNENDDDDGDGFSNCTGDCDDTESATFPGNPEVCDGVDNDCNTGIDDLDLDGDGHTVCSEAGDCDDNDPTAYPVVVSTTGSATGAGTDTDPYDTIATGLANLDAECRTVVLEAGTYSNVSVNWTSGSVTLVGRTGDADDVVLNADPALGRHFTVGDGADLVLRDLTLSAGNTADDGGAVSVANAALELDGVVVTANTAANGGGVAAVGSDLRIHGKTRFVGNTSVGDGGALRLSNTTLDDDGTTYLDNVAGFRGGAVYLVGGNVAIDGAEIRSNDAVEGGGIAVTTSGDYQIERSWFVANTASGDGAGLSLRDVGSLGGNVRASRFQDNVAQGGGGGIAVVGASGAIRIANNTIAANEAVAGDGSAIWVSVGFGAGLELLGNVVHSNDGASAVSVDSGGTAVATYNTAYLTNSGIHFAGEIGDGSGFALDPTNVVRDPQLAAVSDDGNPDNDDLTLQGGSPEIDDGPPFAELNDPDGSRNDRGYTGGPAAE
ncbi:MAG: MopE-related protein [Myxococcota bacterium]